MILDVFVLTALVFVSFVATFMLVTAIVAALVRRQIKKVIIITNDGVLTIDRQPYRSTWREVRRCAVHALSPLTWYRRWEARHDG